MTDINRTETQGYDRWLKASDMSNEDSLPDVKKKQAQKAGEHMGITTGKAVLGMLEVVEFAPASIAAPFVVGASAFHDWATAHLEGDELNAALYRDAASHAVLNLGSDGFGEKHAGFVQAERNRLVGEYERDESGQKLMAGTAARMVSQVTASEGGLDNARAAVSAGVEDGIRFAEERSFRSPEEAARFFEHCNPAFRERYESDPAFHLGVDAVVWRAQQPAPKPN